MRTSKQIYGIYDLDDFCQMVGTIKECCVFLNITEHTFYLNMQKAERAKKYVIKKLFTEKKG